MIWRKYPQQTIMNRWLVGEISNDWIKIENEEMPKGESLIPKAGARNDAQEVEMDEENIVKDMEEVTPMDDGKLVNEGLVDGPDIPDVTRATQ